jgi:AcrR family transcriptional regulator
LREKTIEKRRNFLNVGRKLFFEKGYINVSVKEICDQLNTTTGSFYFMFSSKEKLLEELLLEDLKKLWNVGDEIKTEELSLKKKIHLYLKTSLEFITSEMELILFYENLLSENGIGGKIAQEIKKISLEEQEKGILDIYTRHKDEIQYDKNYLKSLARYTVLIFQDKYNEIIEKRRNKNLIDYDKEVILLSETIEGLIKVPS